MSGQPLSAPGPSRSVPSRAWWSASISFVTTGGTVPTTETLANYRPLYREVGAEDAQVLIRPTSWRGQKLPLCGQINKDQTIAALLMTKAQNI